MVSLSDNLSNIVSDYLGKEIITRDFTVEELDKVTSLDLSKNDISYLKNFNNIEFLTFSGFPSVDEKDIVSILELVPNLKKLIIKEQSALIKLDLSKFKSLEELELIHNDNLISLSGVVNLKKFKFYDNKDFINVQQIVDLILNSKNCEVTLDIVYYAGVIRCINELEENIKIVDKFKWIESVGLRKHIEHEYTDDELRTLIQQVLDIVSKYVYVTDGEIEKFGVLYYWMVHNISFVNEDDPKDEDVNNVSNIYKVFNYRKGGRLSFAKAFQLLLSFADVKSSVVYSLGATETIGYYNGEQVYSLLGTSDYALLRVSIDGRYYYSDIAWDSMVSTYRFFDELRLLLVSKDELKIRHKFVGEGNIISSYSYHGDDSDDLIMFANDRIKNVDEVMNDIERFKPAIVGVEMNRAIISKEIARIKDEMEKIENSDSTEYINLEKDLTDNEESLIQDDTELVKLNNQRDGVIESYSSFLNEHYLNWIEDNSKDKLLIDLNNRRKMLLLSDYMYNMLSTCIK